MIRFRQFIDDSLRETLFYQVKFYLLIFLPQLITQSYSTSRFPLQTSLFLLFRKFFVEFNHFLNILIMLYDASFNFKRQICLVSKVILVL